MTDESSDEEIEAAEESRAQRQREAELSLAAILKEFNDAAEASAKRGDYGSLIAIARGGWLTKSQQRLVADILEGKIRRTRANVLKKGDRYMEIGNHVLDLERSGTPTKNAVKDTAKHFDESERTVWTARKFAVGIYKVGRLVDGLLQLT
jgi:hypothetical protein